MITHNTNINCFKTKYIAVFLFQGWSNNNLYNIMFTYNIKRRPKDNFKYKHFAVLNKNWQRPKYLKGAYVR